MSAIQGTLQTHGIVSIDKYTIILYLCLFVHDVLGTTADWISLEIFLQLDKGKKNSVLPYCKTRSLIPYQYLVCTLVFIGSPSLLCLHDLSQVTRHLVYDVDKAVL